MGIYFQKSLFVCDGPELYFLSSKIVEKLKLNNENAINKLCCGIFELITNLLLDNPKTGFIYFHG
jgi:hypothetical protein